MTVRATTILVILLALLASWALAQSEPFMVKIGCQGERLTVSPERIESLILRASGRVVVWSLETAGCPPTAHSVEIRFERSSPFGEELEHRELQSPELPQPLPPTIELLRREIFLPGEHRYRVLLVDSERRVLAQGEGRISARVIAPALGTWGAVAALMALAALLWGLRRRLWP
ncbi:MAG: hypothetical protein NZ610_00490 [Candidatus Bipolaricaulota bacterium]|nr:hypothetical protein [Candidatus Bipolaricaulota bacterium]MCS7273875.1 hypothetical protein [Candidatus Bipolaricaulota bacterium]MDW8110707.1 hypothetical protein [Candidatus Bipolaricaulota bacterium]MDW8328435.1 hypothetical protein [Candidatus Bipolaricaulota bacterium]